MGEIIKRIAKLIEHNLTNIKYLYENKVYTVYLHQKEIMAEMTYKETIPIIIDYKQKIVVRPNYRIYDVYSVESTIIAAIKNEVNAENKSSLLIFNGIYRWQISYDETCLISLGRKKIPPTPISGLLCPNSNLFITLHNGKLILVL